MSGNVCTLPHRLAAAQGAWWAPLHHAEKHMDQNPRTYTRAALRMSAVVFIALGAACASTPPAPLASLQAAQQAITAAESIDAGHSAPGDLAEARTKLAAANLAVKNERMVSADQLALQSRAAAELASARTASVKALAVNAEMKSGNAAMVEELNRRTGESK
jgi:hypothetical protein